MRAVPVVVLAIAGCGRVGFDAVPADARPDAPDNYRLSTSGTWTWMAGPSQVKQLGVYGTRGIAAPTNQPGSRDNGAEWLVGDELWVFGGIAFGETGTDDVANDLWRYATATGQWTWIHGPTQPGELGTYGTQGTSTSATTPGGRNDVLSWVDTAGDLWLYGGAGFDSVSAARQSLGDVWRFDRDTVQWTWMSGSEVATDTASYGVIGVASPSNTPGPRDSGAAWVEGTSVYVFGGFGRGSGATDGLLSDVWRYDMASALWTWVAGPSTIGGAPSYGTRGVAADTNTPGGRVGACAIDGWLFGGDTGDLRGDLWRLTNNRWTWVSGSSQLDAMPLYGERGRSDATTQPGARAGVSCWTDASGNFWLFGGGTFTDESYGDLWVYSPVFDTWTWVSGDAGIPAAGVWGQRGIGTATTTPSGRNEGNSWRLPDGSLWLFGGDYTYDTDGGFGQIGDLWRFIPD